MSRTTGPYIIVIIVIAIIGFGGVYSHRYLDKSASGMAIELKEIKKSVKEENWGKSRELYAEFNDNWVEAHKKWALFTDHMELDNIEMKVVRGKSFIDEEDRTNAIIEIDEAIMLLEHIPERDRLTLTNIF